MSLIIILVDVKESDQDQKGAVYLQLEDQEYQG